MKSDRAVIADLPEKFERTQWCTLTVEQATLYRAVIDELADRLAEGRRGKHRGATMFWIFGLLLTLWVGPAQASSRSFMARIAPAGREGEMFGLYATTGRAASFLAPALFALFSGLFSDRIGIVGIALVLLAGTLLLARVKSPPRQQIQVSE